MDVVARSMHGRPVLPALLVPLSRILHYAGFGLAIGALVSVALLRRASGRRSGGERRALDEVVPGLVAKVEIPGLFLALAGGVLAVALSPSHLKPSGAGGPWLLIKLPLVMALIAIAHIRLWSAQVLAREGGARGGDATDHERRGARLDRVEILLVLAILIIATFRFSLFG